MSDESVDTEINDTDIADEFDVDETASPDRVVAVNTAHQ